MRRPVDSVRPRIRFAALAKQPRGVTTLACGVLTLILVLAFVLPAVTGYAPEAFVGLPNQPPSLAHPFGTDGFGRDVMVRTFAAAKVDYLVPLLVVFIAMLLGNILGVVAALLGGPIEWVIMRLSDAVIAFPFIILILALVVLFGNQGTVPLLPSSTLPIIIAVSVTGWAYYARIARSQALVLRGTDYVTAATLMGYSTWRILWRHVVPKVMGVSITYAIGDVVAVMGLIASLSIFGAGIAPPTAEWGQMMFEGRLVLEQYWWVTVFPLVFMIASAISLAAIAEHLIARLERRSK